MLASTAQRIRFERVERTNNNRFSSGIKGEVRSAADRRGRLFSNENIVINASKGPNAGRIPAFEKAVSKGPKVGAPPS